MKEDLIKLANEKGFSAKYTTTRDKFYYLWMCELKIWLLDKQAIFVHPDFFIENETIYWDFEIVELTSQPILLLQDDNAFDEYRQALEKGLYEALKLIQK